MKSRWLTIALICAGGCSAAHAAANKISPELQNVGTQIDVDVIVQFDHVPTVDDHQKVLGRGGKRKNALNMGKAGGYTMSGAALLDLANDPSVVHISPDHKVGPKLDYTTAATNATIAWQSGWDGTGIGVAVIDSGISAGPDFQGNTPTSSRIVYSQDFTGGSGSDQHGQAGGDGSDQYGHGTHVAGIIAGNGNNSSCKGCIKYLKGMAPNANLINLRVLDANGEGSDSAVIAAINRAIELKSTYNIRVINLSMGRGVFESYAQDPLCRAVEAAWKAGIVVVVAAGNDGRDNSVGENGYGMINAPGNDPYVLTVGAMKAMDTYTRTDDLIASYSSKGPSLFDNVVKPDLVAPGNGVVSVLAAGSPTLFTQYPGNAVPA